MEKTFAIIKPDAVSAGYSGDIIKIIENKGFTISGMKKIRMLKEVAERFYAVHAGKPFFDDLTTFMSSSPCIVMVLEKKDAIRSWRELMGATDPAQAIDGSIRKLFGRSIDRNVVHGSDAPETAAEEVKFFFSTVELVD